MAVMVPEIISQGRQDLEKCKRKSEKERQEDFEKTIAELFKICGIKLDRQFGSPTFVMELKVREVLNNFLARQEDIFTDIQLCEAFVYQEEIERAEEFFKHQLAEERSRTTDAIERGEVSARCLAETQASLEESNRQKEAYRDIVTKFEKLAQQQQQPWEQSTACAAASSSTAASEATPPQPQQQQLVQLPQDRQEQQEERQTLLKFLEEGEPQQDEEQQDQHQQSVAPVPLFQQQIAAAGNRETTGPAKKASLVSGDTETEPVIVDAVPLKSQSDAGLRTDLKASFLGLVSKFQRHAAV
eukprot:TRINITY_DN1020_c0_g1_i1.p1 TRINITY_DN1020_c0_g1~~TRINITY_DN1020_c0_g1_i1.p1  ORF type:complete len:300 (+),score=100.27 TRINITY_DN1020_c0_g1_i1:51-950(+)